MGFRNAPATQQRRVTNVLSAHIGKICHVYMNNIIIWSNDLEEHEVNVHTIMDTLHKARLYVNKKKTNFFSYEIAFLGHIILHRGVEANPDKVTKILD